MAEKYYDDGTCVIYHGDALDVLPTLPRVDLVLTDPPFFMPAQHYAGRTGWQRSWADTSILARWWQEIVDVLVPRLREHGHLITFCDDESYAVFYPPLYARFDNLASLVWDKGKPGMGSTWRHSHELLIAARWKGASWNGGAKPDIYRHPSIPSQARLHPVDKPVELVGEIIGDTCSTAATVLDPFMGGGSTLVAAKARGRKAIGIELDERYCEIAAKRLAQGALDFGETRHP